MNLLMIKDMICERIKALLKEKIGESTDTDTNTLMGKSNAVLAAAENTIPLYRQDDYLAYTVAAESAISSSTTLVNDGKEHEIAALTCSEDCHALDVEYTVTNDAFYVYVYDGNGNALVSNEYNSSKSTDGYRLVQYRFDSNIVFPVKVKLKSGTSSTVKFTKFSMKAYKLSKVVSEEKYQAGTIKGYGYTGSSDSGFLLECPRMDRTELKIYRTYSSSTAKSWGGADIIFVDDIPYIRKVGAYNEYKILY